MKTRHLVMLLLAGVIGTGLFFNTGYIISTTGAAGTLLAYLIGALVVWLVMVCLGELSVAMPETGAFHVYAAPGLSNLTQHGWLLHGILPIIMTMVAVNFAFSGTELMGIAAGETENPQKVLPLAIRTTVARLIIFFVGTVLVLAALIPMDQAGIVKSPVCWFLNRSAFPMRPMWSTS